MPRPCAPLDRSGRKAPDPEIMAQKFKPAHLAQLHRAVRRRHITGQRIGRLVKSLRQRSANKPDQRIQPVFLRKRSRTMPFTEATRSLS